MRRTRSLGALISFAVVALFVLAPHAEAAGWQNGPPDGTRWENGRVSVVVGAAGGAGRALRAAIRDWNRSNVVHLTLTSRPVDTPATDPCAVVPGAVVVCVTNGSSDDANFSGWTQTYTDVRGFSTAGVVWLNLAIVQRSSKSDRQSLACHELGHAIGLAHQDGKSCMNGVTWPVHPDAFDYKALDDLYAGAFGVVAAS